MQFHYQTPREGFDHARVNGVVAKLIDMKDPKYATALEITAGGKVSCKSKYMAHPRLAYEYHFLKFVFIEQEVTVP